jgi:hypothetical protein
LFFNVVLASYVIFMVQLHLRAVAILAVFHNLWESFVGAMPSVAFFRHFFRPSAVHAEALARGVGFFLQCRLEWCLVRFPKWLDHVEDLDSPAATDPTWDLLRSRDDDLAHILKMI